MQSSCLPSIEEALHRAEAQALDHRLEACRVVTRSIKTNTVHEGLQNTALKNLGPHGRHHRVDSNTALV